MKMCNSTGLCLGARPPFAPMGLHTLCWCSVNLFWSQTPCCSYAVLPRSECLISNTSNRSGYCSQGAKLHKRPEPAAVPAAEAGTLLCDGGLPPAPTLPGPRRRLGADLVAVPHVMIRQRQPSPTALGLRHFPRDGRGWVAEGC